MLAAVLAGGVCQMNACGLDETAEIPEGYVAETAEGLMFDDAAGARTYNYCPCVIVEGDTAHVWYCSSVEEGIGGDDHIAYRSGKRADGVWYWSPKKIVLGAEEGTYYSGNICDPDVVKGEFHMQGETYSYLMAVLGCTTKDNSSNMFGFKAAKSPEGPWIDVPSVSPLYNFYDYYPGYVYNGANEFIWGWGQCSLVSVDKKGKVLLFYTGRSATSQKLECWDFSDLDHPKGLYETEVRNQGVFDLNGAQDSICNAQFMYDEAASRFYMICDVHPFRTDRWPTNLPEASRVYYFDDFSGGEPGEAFLGKNLQWRELFTLNEAATGFPHNHNCCFFRDPYGRKPEGKELEIAYTKCDTGEDWTVLFGYRIYRYTYRLGEQ